MHPRVRQCLWITLVNLALLVGALLAAKHHQNDNVQWASQTDSDIETLHKRAAELEFELQVVNQKLHALKRSKRQSEMSGNSDIDDFSEESNIAVENLLSINDTDNAYYDDYYNGTNVTGTYQLNYNSSETDIVSTDITDEVGTSKKAIPMVPEVWPDTPEDMQTLEPQNPRENQLPDMTEESHQLNTQNVPSHKAMVLDQEADDTSSETTYNGTENTLQSSTAPTSTPESDTTDVSMFSDSPTPMTTTVTNAIINGDNGHKHGRPLVELGNELHSSEEYNDNEKDSVISNAIEVLAADTVVLNNSTENLYDSTDEWDNVPVTDGVEETTTSSNHTMATLQSVSPPSNEVTSTAPHNQTSESQTSLLPNSTENKTTVESDIDQCIKLTQKQLIEELKRKGTYKPDLMAWDARGVLKFLQRSPGGDYVAVRRTGVDYDSVAALERNLAALERLLREIGAGECNLRTTTTISRLYNMTVASRHASGHPKSGAFPGMHSAMFQLGGRHGRFGRNADFLSRENVQLLTELGFDEPAIRRLHFDDNGALDADVELGDNVGEQPVREMWRRDSTVLQRDQPMDENGRGNVIGVLWLGPLGLSLELWLQLDLILGFGSGIGTWHQVPAKTPRSQHIDYSSKTIQAQCINWVVKAEAAPKETTVF